jgi:hypothetical protein
MKFSLTLSVLILVIGSSLNWQDSKRLVVVRETRTKLAAEAAVLGISPDPSRSSDSGRISKHERESKQSTAAAVLVEFATFVKELEASGKSLESLDEADEKRMKEIMARVRLLDPAQLKMLATEVNAADGLTAEFSQRLFIEAIRVLENDYPQTALVLMTEAPALLTNIDRGGKFFISSLLANWGKADPMAALKWVRENATKFPELVTDRAKESMLEGMATHDPKLAFKLVDELGLKDTWQALCKISDSSKTSEGRTATLAAVRDYLANRPKDQGQSDLIGRFTGGITMEGFASASQWFAGADFTPSELETIADSLSYSIKPDETSQWIDWIGNKLPAEKSAGPIRNMVGRWTEIDYQAAGKWLASTPAGPTKNAAIRSYAETVSTLDPATATQWAMTLPPGPDREATLKHIQDHPPTKWPSS